MYGEQLQKLDSVEAKSSGVKASGKVNPNAKKLLEEKGIWRDEYHSKTLDTVIDVSTRIIFRLQLLFIKFTKRLKTIL